MLLIRPSKSHSCSFVCDDHYLTYLRFEKPTNRAVLLVIIIFIGLDSTWTWESHKEVLSFFNIRSVFWKYRRFMGIPMRVSSPIQWSVLGCLLVLEFIFSDPSMQDHDLTWSVSLLWMIDCCSSRCVHFSSHRRHVRCRNRYRRFLKSTDTRIWVIEKSPYSRCSWRKIDGFPLQIGSYVQRWKKVGLAVHRVIKVMFSWFFEKYWWPKFLLILLSCASRQECGNLRISQILDYHLKYFVNSFSNVICNGRIFWNKSPCVILKWDKFVFSKKLFGMVSKSDTLFSWKCIL